MIKVENKQKLLRDGSVFILAVAAGIFIATSDTVHNLLLQLLPVTFLAELIAGALYTSILVVPLSMSLLSILAGESNIFLIAAIGGIGATLGDYFIMRVLHHSTQNISVRRPEWSQKLPRMFKKIALRITGVLLLILPTPDEAAMGVLGISRVNLKIFILLVYPAKAFALFLIILSLQSL